MSTEAASGGFLEKKKNIPKNGCSESYQVKLGIEILRK